MVHCYSICTRKTFTIDIPKAPLAAVNVQKWTIAAVWIREVSTAHKFFPKKIAQCPTLRRYTCKWNNKKLQCCYPSLQTVFDLCIPKKDLAKSHSQVYPELSWIIIFCLEFLKFCREVYSTIHRWCRYSAVSIILNNYRCNLLWRRFLFSDLNYEYGPLNLLFYYFIFSIRDALPNAHARLIIWRVNWLCAL